MRESRAISGSKRPTRLLLALLGAQILVVAALAAPAAAGSAARPPKIWFTDASGMRIHRASLGQVIRIISTGERVCVAWRSGPGICASPQNPHILRRRVNENLVVDGRIRASDSDFVGNRRVGVTTSIPVS